MSGFDVEFLQVYENGSFEKTPCIPSIWNKISSTPLFRQKLIATAELGVTLCPNQFSWDMRENDSFIRGRGIKKFDIAPLLEPFAEDSPDINTLLTCAQKLKSLFRFELQEIDVIGLIRSCAFRVPITSNCEPSELFQSTRYEKSCLQTLSAFPMFCMNRDMVIKECKNFSFGSFKEEFNPLVTSCTRLDWFAGFLSEYKPSSETAETPNQEIEIITDSKYFSLSFIEREDSEDNNESGPPDFLKVITQMRLILSQTARCSVVTKVRNFHNCICCHAILSSNRGDKVIILTMKPSFSRTDDRDDNICIDYLLYLSGVYNMKEKEDRIMLCNFLITSAYMASSISKLIGDNLLIEEKSQQSTFSSPRPKYHLQENNLLFCNSHPTDFAIKIEKEIANGGDTPLYEGTIVGTEDKCIVKIYNNNRDSGYLWWNLRLHTSLTAYNGETEFDIPYSDVSYKGTPLKEYLNTNKEKVNKTTLMIQLLAQLYYLHQKKVLHNDIKPENIIVYQDYPYFIDFEAYKKYARYDKEKEICYGSDYDGDGGAAIQSSSGTRAYNPPEKDLTTKNYVTPKSDIYSLGLVFAKILLDFSLQTMDIKNNIESLNLTNFDQTVCHLIKAMVSHDIKTRPSTQQCLETLGVSKSDFEKFDAPIINKPKPSISMEDFQQLLEAKKRGRTESVLYDIEPEEKKAKHN